jgi:hypothetical protein
MFSAAATPRAHRHSDARGRPYGQDGVFSAPGACPRCSAITAASRGQRLDHLVAAYLKNPIGFGGGATRISRSRPTRWPRELIAVPVKKR